MTFLILFVSLLSNAFTLFVLKTILRYHFASTQQIRAEIERLDLEIKVLR